MMERWTFTAESFAPVQEFLLMSRKTFGEISGLHVQNQAVARCMPEKSGWGVQTDFLCVV